jgi:hypothetical protein
MPAITTTGRVVLLIVMLLSSACAPLGLSVRESVTRTFFEERYAEWWSGVYAAQEAGVEYVGPALLAEYALSPEARDAATLPAQVIAALDFYFTEVEAQDWGNVTLHFVDSPDAGGEPLWAIRTSTDGDDGWLEVYAADGELLGAARTWIELIAWNPRPQARAMVGSRDYPASLADRNDRTLWRLPDAPQ